MSKLKLNKITISNLNLEDSTSIVGGRQEASDTIIICSIITSIIFSVVTSSVCPPTMSHNTNCLTDRPGTQDSCGLCNPKPDIH